jgi:hypothetical protein
MFLNQWFGKLLLNQSGINFFTNCETEQRTTLLRTSVRTMIFCLSLKCGTPKFFRGKIYSLILTKMGWATFWAIFSQTYLVTLVTQADSHFST